jgi:peptide/nickel transport system permease protein
MSAYDFSREHGEDETISGRFYRSVIQNPLLSGAAVIVVVMFFTAALGPVLSPHDPLKTDLSLRLASPCLQYPLGNDALGRCLFSRILSGARMSIGLGISVVTVSCLLGVLIGLVAGYQGGLMDELLMRIADIFLSLPEIVAAMTLAGLMGPGTLNLIFALSITGWIRYARLVRGITLSVKERDYVKAAQFCGASKIVIVFRHILPANIGSVIVLATIGLAKAIIAVSALGFLGFGVQPPSPEWGTLLMEGKDYILSAPHLAVYPGIAIMLSVLAINLLGDSLRDVWNPGQ